MNKPFLQVLKGKKAAHIPCWFMRQAGRYLPEYRELRAQKGGFLELAFDPKAACEVTIQPLRRFHMDAAIIFSDILVIPYALGQDLKFAAGEGPQLPPIRTLDEINALAFDDEKLEPVYEALRLTRKAMQDEGFDQTALIGFAGAPWTVATYMVEGGGSKDYPQTKEMAFARPEIFQRLIDILVDSTSRYLIKQIEAGAEALQIFDSWAGVLNEEQFKRWAIDPVAEIIRRVKAVHPDIPIIGFPRGAALYYPAYLDAVDVDAVGLDTTVPLDWAVQNLQTRVPVQGNLDPMALLAGGDVMKHEAEKILTVLGDKPFIFNLGHGIHKETPPEHVAQLMEIIHSWKK